MIGIIAISTKCDSRKSLRPCCSHPCDSRTCSPALKLYDHHDHRETLLQHAKTLVHQRGSISSSYTDHLWTFPPFKEALSPGLSISYFREPGASSSDDIHCARENPFDYDTKPQRCQIKNCVNIDNIYNYIYIYIIYHII